MVTDALGTTMGLEALTLMSMHKVQKADGFNLPVTTLTVMLASGLDQALHARQIKGEGTGTGTDIRLLDPRNCTF